MIKPATREDVFRVASNMRDEDYAEFSATSFTKRREDLADALAYRYGDRPDVLCGFCKGKPTCIGGTIETWPGVMSLLFFATDDFQQIGRMITRFIRRELFPRYAEAGIHRIQAISLEDHTQSHAWLSVLGLEKEAVLKDFGKNKETFFQFAKVN